MLLADSQFLETTLPRQVGGMLAAPTAWSGTATLKSAAVCMIFIPDPEDPGAPARVLLTKRTVEVRTHKGQIAFPGGHLEKADQSPAATALRELYEEVGIPPEMVRVHGCLAPTRSLLNDAVFTMIGTANIAPKDMRLSAQEVAEAILPPWPLLMRERSEPFEFTMYGQTRQSHLFRYEAHRIWGLTAGMIYAADIRAL